MQEVLAQPPFGCCEEQTFLLFELLCREGNQFQQSQISNKQNKKKAHLVAVAAVGYNPKPVQCCTALSFNASANDLSILNSVKTR